MRPPAPDEDFTWEPHARKRRWCKPRSVAIVLLIFVIGGVCAALGNRVSIHSAAPAAMLASHQEHRIEAEAPAVRGSPLVEILNAGAAEKLTRSGPLTLRDLTNVQIMENAPDSLAGERAAASALADRRQDTAPDYQALRQQMLRGE